MIQITANFSPEFCIQGCIVLPLAANRKGGGILRQFASIVCNSANRFVVCCLHFFVVFWVKIQYPSNIELLIHWMATALFFGTVWRCFLFVFH